MKRIFPLLSVLILTGCVEYRWTKPGASEHDRIVATTECKAKALKALPPQNVISGSHADIQKSNHKKDKTADLRIEVRDVNEDNRAIIEQDCMYQKGWSLKEIKH